MEFNLNRQEELTIPIVEDYLEQYDLWENKAINSLRSEKVAFADGWWQKERDILVERAEAENPRLIPVVKASYSVDSSLVGKETKSFPVGTQMYGTGIVVTGHISDSTLWLIDTKENSIQTMVRIAVRHQGEIKLIDVYSKIVHPGITRVGGANQFNVQSAKASSVRNLLNYVENSKVEVLGWVPIAEISEQKIPSYS